MRLPTAWFFHVPSTTRWITFQVFCYMGVCQNAQQFWHRNIKNAHAMVKCFEEKDRRDENTKMVI